MNYIKIKKTGLLFLASTSYLSATTTTPLPETTQGKVDQFFGNFSAMNRLYQSKGTIDNKKINILKQKIIDSINSDSTIVNQTKTDGRHKTLLMRASVRGRHM